MKNKKATERMLEIKAKQWKWRNGKLHHVPLNAKDQKRLTDLQKEISNSFSEEEFEFYSAIIEEAGGTVMKEPLRNTRLSSYFFVDKVSKTHGKHNLPKELWDRISKIRKCPIQLTKDLILGDSRAAHTVIPAKSKGYLVIHPEAFALTDQQLLAMQAAPSQRIAAIFIPYPEIVFIKRSDFKEILPFFDMALACSAASEVHYGCA